jgi:hypothetical protein
LWAPKRDGTTTYGMKPSTLMFGRFEVGETVKLKYDLLLES